MADDAALIAEVEAKLEALKLRLPDLEGNANIEERTQVNKDIYALENGEEYVAATKRKIEGGRAESAATDDAAHAAKLKEEAAAEQARIAAAEAAAAAKAAASPVDVTDHGGNPNDADEELFSFSGKKKKKKKKAGEAEDSQKKEGLVYDSERAGAVQQRADACGLPAHLRLGLTVKAMQKHVDALPLDAVAQCNAAIPKGDDGAPCFPPNTELNGYVNQFMIKQTDSGNTSVCERLQQCNSQHVGTATVFVSWALSANVHTLIDALRQYLLRHPEMPSNTKFWVCDFVVRQGRGDLSNLVDFANCVSVVGCTVLLLEPWSNPVPLKRTWCVFEVYHTQKHSAPFEVVMSSTQQAAFEEALVSDFDAIARARSEIDVRKCECNSPTDTKWLIDEIERDVGLSACNQVVLELMREELVGRARMLLSQKSIDDDAWPVLMNRVGLLLHDNSNMIGARKLYEQLLTVQHGSLGERHPQTLLTRSILGTMTAELGDPDEGVKLLRRVLEAQREALGDRHVDSLKSLNSLCSLLRTHFTCLSQDSRVRAKALCDEALQLHVEVFDERHPQTLLAIRNLSWATLQMGDAVHAEELLRQTLAAQRETLGERHEDTLQTMSDLHEMLRDLGELDGAAALGHEALHGLRETLGPQHAITRQIATSMLDLLERKGDQDGAQDLRHQIKQSRVANRDNCRMYENEFPEEEDLVMGQVQSIRIHTTDKVKLLEYDGIEAVAIDTVSSFRRSTPRRRLRLINGVGGIRVYRVLRVDKEKGFCDLSQHRVTPEDNKMCRERFQRSSVVHQIVRRVSEMQCMDMELLYQQTAWPLYRNFGHAYEAFSVALDKPDTVFTSELMPDHLRHTMLNTIRAAFARQADQAADHQAALLWQGGIARKKAEQYGL